MCGEGEGTQEMQLYACNFQLNKHATFSFMCVTFSLLHVTFSFVHATFSFVHVTFSFVHVTFSFVHVTFSFVHVTFSLNACVVPSCTVLSPDSLSLLIDAPDHHLGSNSEQSREHQI